LLYTLEMCSISADTRYFIGNKVANIKMY